jgi:hypothetical protein
MVQLMVLFSQVPHDLLPGKWLTSSWALPRSRSSARRSLVPCHGYRPWEDTKSAVRSILRKMIYEWEAKSMIPSGKLT